MAFRLDPVLERDSIWVGDIDGFTCRLINDSRYPWLVLIPTADDVSEIYQLDHSFRHRLADLSASLGQELMRLYNGDKFNVASIGNIVQQLHVHHVVRKKDDAAWPAPVWGIGEAVPYSHRQQDELLSELRQNLSLFSS